MVRKGFNWKGINDNGDGSFTTKGKIEKKRLLKSLHTSGYKVRSRRNSDGSWTVTTIGTMRPKRTRQTSHGYRPAVRAARGNDDDSYVTIPRNRSGSAPRGRYVPIKGRYVPIRGKRMIGPAPRPAYPGSSGGFRRPRESFGSKLARYQKERRERMEADKKKEVEWKNTEKELNDKMRTDRIEKERQEATHQIHRNEEKQRFREEAARFEQEERTRQMQQKSQQTQQRHTEFQAEREKVRQDREQKVNQTSLQEAREESVTGE